MRDQDVRRYDRNRNVPTWFDTLLERQVYEVFLK